MTIPNATHALPQAVLFDLDGTLVDTAPDLGGTIIDMQAARGLQTTPLDALRPVASAGARGLLGVGFGLNPEHADYEPLRLEFLQRYEARIAAQSKLFDGFDVLFDHFDKKGIRWGVVTNKAERLAHLLMEGLNLHLDCAVLIGGDTTAHAKPHPLPCLTAAERIGLAPGQCWYVGDDLRDILAGRAAGMPTVAAAYGYCGVHDPAHAWGAEHLVNSVQELHALLQC
jgi:phosphoglycolate phosphatase